MKTNLHFAVIILMAIGVGLVVGLTLDGGSQAIAQDKGATMTDAARYSVIDTHATNLIVTDNKTNTLYFYTIEKEKEPGAELILRGSIDLNQVGSPMIRPAVGKK